jgi:hypothetical protein
MALPLHRVKQESSKSRTDKSKKDNKDVKRHLAELNNKVLVEF